jgi:hypothetical protein
MGVSMEVLVEMSLFVEDSSLQVTSLVELTPEFVIGCDAAMPILEDRSDCGDDQLWCDLVATSTGHMIVWDTVQSYTQELELHWTGSSSEFIVEVYNTNSNPSQSIPLDIPRHPAEMNITCRPGYNTSSWGPNFYRTSTTDGEWSGSMPVCMGVPMAALYDTVTFVKDGSLELSTVTEFTPEFVTGRGAVMPILLDRNECGDDELWCDLVAPSSGHMLVWDTEQSYTQEFEHHWTGSTSEFIVEVYNTNSNPSQSIPLDMPRHPAEMNITCRPGYNTSSWGPNFYRTSTTDGEWSGSMPVCMGVPMAALYETLNFRLGRFFRSVVGH